MYIKATAGNISINGKKTVKISAGAGSSRLEIGNGVISFNGQQLATLPALSDLIDARLKAHRLIS